METSTFLWTTLWAAALVLVVKWLIWRIPRRFASGPWGVPLFGYLPFLSPTPCRDYLQLKEKYGDIFALRLGTKYAIVLSDFAHIKEAFNKDEFTYKPPGWFRIYSDSDSVVDMNGKEWKEMRRFTLSTLRNLGMGKNKVEEAIKEEIIWLIKKLDSAERNAEINVYDITNVSFLNVILTILCGRSFEDGDRLVDMMEEYNSYMSEGFSWNQRATYFPFLKTVKWLKSLLPSKNVPAVDEIRAFIRNEIEKHKREHNEEDISDFISYYLEEIKHKSGNSAVKSTNMMADTEMILFAATDSTRVGLAWILLFLAMYQDYQEEIYQEIITLLGKEKPPSWSDKDKLPLTNAFIMEVSRYKTPSETVHWSSKEESIGGYCIPKHSLVIANAEAVHMDPKLWGDPENFRPWRFLSPDRQKAVEPEYWIPFLIGKRMCPGTKLANMQLFLFTASLVHKFRVLPPKSGLSLEDRKDVLISPLKPLVVFQRRD